MKQIKINNFSLDRSLGYLIQHSAKESTQEILSYFYGIAQFVVEDLSKTSKAAFLDKDIILFYKESPISYRLRITGRGPGNHRSDPAVNVHVTYPNHSDNYDVSELMTSIVEFGLGLSDEPSLSPFERPVLKSPRCLREVRMKQAEERLKSQ